MPRSRRSNTDMASDGAPCSRMGQWGRPGSRAAALNASESNPSASFLLLTPLFFVVGLGQPPPPAAPLTKLAPLRLLAPFLGIAIGAKKRMPGLYSPSMPLTLSQKMLAIRM